MRVIRYYQTASEKKPCVLGLGNFDGVHVGHQAIIDTVCDLAKKHDLAAALMTFYPHHRNALFNEPLDAFQIYPLREKLLRLKEQGIDILYLVPFTKKFALTSAKSFIEDVCLQGAYARHLVSGNNFTFGAKRLGDVTMMQQLARAQSAHVTTVSLKSDDEGVTISSTRIRALFQTGDMSAIAKALGSSYRVAGKIVHGQKRGRKLGFPTINLRLHHRLIPKFGIYTCRVQFAGQATWHKGVGYIGQSPMFEGNTPLFEMHIFDFNQDVYHQYVTIECLSFIREEGMFISVEKLKEQMSQDCNQAHAWFLRHLDL